MGAVVKIWFESLIPFLLKDSHIVHWEIGGLGQNIQIPSGYIGFTFMIGLFITSMVHKIHRGNNRVIRNDTSIWRSQDS